MTISIGVAQGPQHAASPRELIALRRGGDDDREGARQEPGRPLRRGRDRAARRPRPPGATCARSAHLKLLQSLAGKLNRLNDVQEIGATIATELRLLIDYHNCRVFLRDGDG